MVDGKVNNRKLWLDFGRGISIYLIILFHSEIYFPLSDSDYSQLFGYFRLPFFFFLSGYLFTSDYRIFSIRKKFSQIVCRLVWTYFVFTSIILIPKAFANDNSIWQGICDILLGRASWFIVTLGGVYIMWAVVVKFFKSIMVYVFFMFISILAAYYVKYNYMPLPYFFDCMLVGNFFIGLGLFYRIYEFSILKFLKSSYLLLAIFIVVFFTITYIDRIYLGTAINIFYGEQHNFLLTVCYGVLGIMMMVILVKTIPAPRWICFIGVNSLVFYYLNGGVLRVLSFLFDSMRITQWLEDNAGSVAYFCVVMMSLCACAVIAVVSRFINRYFPVMTGDRKVMKKVFKLKWIV